MLTSAGTKTLLSEVDSVPLAALHLEYSCYRNQIGLYLSQILHA